MEIETRDTSDVALAAIADPVMRAKALRDIARDRGTLTRAQSQLYRATIAELRGDNERKHGWIARTIGVSRGRISQLLRGVAEEPAA